MMNIGAASIIFASFFMMQTSAFAASQTKRMDGVTIEAVESYLNDDPHRFDLGIGIFPFNPYYNGFSLSTSYSYYFLKDFAWEVLHYDYVHSIKTDTTSELAEEYGVNPEKIEKLESILSTNAKYVFAYGKLLFANRFIRYFRVSALSGFGIVNTSERTGQAVSFGLQLELYVNDFLSWEFEHRNVYDFSNQEKYPSFHTGFGMSF